MQFDISRIRHPKEKLYGSMMLIIGLLVWALVALAMIIAVKAQPVAALVIALYVAVIWFLGYVARALMRAHMIGHYVLISHKQFPDLYKMVEDAATRVGLSEAPDAFVYNSSGVMNAMALTLVGRTRYIWLTSALIDADNDEQVRFVIGHEMGHHIAGHLDEPGSFLRMPAYFVPFLGSAYSRGRELTCDRVGDFVSGDLQASQSALQMLACGSAKLNAQMNTEAFREQECMVPGISGWFLTIFSFYPRLTRRVDALTEWRKQQSGAAPRAAQTAVQTRRDPIMQN